MDWLYITNALKTMNQKKKNWLGLKNASEPIHFFEKPQMKEKRISVPPAFLYKLFHKIT